MPVASSLSASSSSLGFPSYKAGTSPIPYLPGGTLSRSEIMSADAHLPQREAVSRQSLFLPLRAQTGSLWGLWLLLVPRETRVGLSAGTHRPILSMVGRVPRASSELSGARSPGPGLSPAQPVVRGTAASSWHSGSTRSGATGRGWT